MNRYTKEDQRRLDEIEIELTTATPEERIALHAERYEIHSKYAHLKTKIIKRNGG